MCGHEPVAATVLYGKLFGLPQNFASVCIVDFQLDYSKNKESYPSHPSVRVKVNVSIEILLWNFAHLFTIMTLTYRQE